MLCYFFSVSSSREKSALPHQLLLKEHRECEEQGHLGPSFPENDGFHGSSRSCWMPTGSPAPRMPRRKGDPNWITDISKYPCASQHFSEQMSQAHDFPLCLPGSGKQHSQTAHMTFPCLSHSVSGIRPLCHPSSIQRYTFH